MSLLVKKNGGMLPSVNDFFDVDTFFRPFLPEFGSETHGLGRMPSVNVSETEKEYRIEVAAPGFDKKDFKVETDNGTLTISAEKQEEKKEEKENIHRKEFSYSKFTRSFQLPENSLSDKIDAKYENGILKLVLPKKEVKPSAPKKEIKVS